MAMVRVWNPSRRERAAMPRGRRDLASPEHLGRRVRLGRRRRRRHRRRRAGARVRPESPGRPPHARDAPTTREVWDNPVIWREIRTWAYGRKILVIRLAYLVLFALAAASLWTGWSPAASRSPGQPAPLALVPLFLLSLVLVNAQAVTSLTSERDGRALDLLLVTDLTPKEIVFGKLGGVFYNTKEMVLLPMLLVRLSLVRRRDRAWRTCSTCWAGWRCCTSSWPCWASMRA